MKNKDIAKRLEAAAQLMALWDYESFKYKAYEKAAAAVRASETSVADGAKPPGIGPSIAEAVKQIVQTGTFDAYEKLRLQTPPGVPELLLLPGLGVKSVQTLWREAHITSVEELKNLGPGLTRYKGFGEKTVQALLAAADFFLHNRGKLRIDRARQWFSQIENELGRKLLTIGEIRRQMPVVETKEALWVGDGEPPGFSPAAQDAPLPAKLWIRGDERIWQCSSEDAVWVRWHLTGSEFHVNGVTSRLPEAARSFADEQEIYFAAGMDYVAPPRRDSENPSSKPPLQASDLRGMVHAHTTYSDGAHTLRQMAVAAQKAGYEYFGVTDHSRTAAYAGGLSIESVRKQHREIEALNQELAPFRIFKGIESDILADGSLDYPEDVLNEFDFIIASVHANLKMDAATATARILNAVSHPKTTVLGHPTGRLLLSREGYPLDHKAVIDRCAETGTAIEINANPARLDLDWKWVDYALERGVKIGVHPDAHSIEGIEDTFWGVLIAQKTGLTPETCFNAADAVAFEQRCKKSS